LLQMELEEFGIGRPELGALILSLWDLPEEVVHAIANHHTKDSHSLSDVSLTTRAVCVAESMLQGHNLQEGTELTDTEGQADTPSMFDGLAQWKPLMEKLVEQGLIHPPLDPVEILTG